MKHTFFYFLFLSLFLLSCSSSPQRNMIEGTAIDFGKLSSVNAADLISDESYVALETNPNSLIGNIDQIEIYDEKIYILDSRNTNALYVFTINGKFITKLEGTGNGPGEFISPHSFWIDPNGYIFILDRQLSRLLKFQLKDLAFIDNVTLPSPAPLSFAVLPEKNRYVYYYPLRQEDFYDGKQYIIADNKGNVINSFYKASASGKILHGCPFNFYQIDGKIRTYPYFSGNVYELDEDVLNCCYTFAWGNLRLPPEELFQQYDNSEPIMKEILTGNNEWIRLLYVYELPQTLLVKYYIKKDFYLSIWHKDSNKIINVKADKINDNMGMGGKFPLPLTTYGNQFVGQINPANLVESNVINERLGTLSNQVSEEDNPILVFYSLK